MKICVVVPAHWEGLFGGSQFQARGLVEKLAELGHEVFYLAHYVREDFVAVDHCVVPLRGWHKSRVFDAWQLYRALGRIEPDVIYQRVGGAYTAVCAYYANRRQVRMVWHLASDMDAVRKAGQPPTRNPLHAVERWMREYGLRHAPYIVAQTESQARLLFHHYNRKVDCVIGNFHPEPMQKLSKSASIKVLWIANLKPLKRPEVFIRLAEDLRNLPNVEFVIIGREWGPDEKQQAFVEQVESIDNLAYLGSLTNEAVNEHLAAAHLLVNTSTIEGFSNTFIQAWMREVPVISLAVNPDGVLTDGSVGFTANGDYSALLECVRSLVTDTKRRTNMGRQARVFASKHYSMRNLEQLADFATQLDAN